MYFYLVRVRRVCLWSWFMAILGKRDRIQNGGLRGDGVGCLGWRYPWRM